MPATTSAASSSSTARSRSFIVAHRRAWPALVRLGRAGILSPDRLASHKQEHMPSGEHHNVVTRFPAWVDDATASVADKLNIDRAIEAFPTWLRPGGKARRRR